MSKKDMEQVCADQSMRRPGFAQLHYDASKRCVTVVCKSHVDNKTAHKCHGQMLSEIAREQRSYLTGNEEQILVREGGFYKYAAETQVLSKVMGVADQYAWAHGGKEFAELAPKTIKKLVAGDAKADKEQVAAGQIPYVGEQEYACDDESDAVAVGVAWLQQNKQIDEAG